MIFVKNRQSLLLKKSRRSRRLSNKKRKIGKGREREFERKGNWLKNPIHAK